MLHSVLKKEARKAFDKGETVFISTVNIPFLDITVRKDYGESFLNQVNSIRKLFVVPHSDDNIIYLLNR